MTATFITTVTVGAGPLHSFTDDGDALVVLQGAALLSSAGSPIAGADFSNLDVLVQGDIFSPGSQTWSGAGVVFTVADTGTVTSTVVGTSFTFLYFQGPDCEITNDGLILASRSVGLASGGGSFISNFGTIRAQSGVFLGAEQSSPDVLVNGGLIQATSIGGSATFTAYRHAVKVGTDGCSITNLAAGRLVADSESGAGIVLLHEAGGATIRNFGSIDSMGNYGINFSFVLAGQASSTVFNRGHVAGGTGAFLGSVNAETVVNRGEMIGAVLMGDGADLLDTRRGTIDGAVNLGAGDDVMNARNGAVLGAILGDAGNDRLIASAIEDNLFNGGTGVDIIDYRFGPAVVLALDGSFENAGAASADEISGVEYIYGSRGGADFLRGNGIANQLRGEGGADTLDGAAGADGLIGGSGADSLIGGLGNDSFFYQNLSHFGDTIADFSTTVGNDDRFQITASAVGGGLALGALAASRFQSRGDNAAQDADDRFIFRTTDQTLWFDVDGTGAEAALMVADLQVGATVTHLDIFMV